MLEGFPAQQNTNPQKSVEKKGTAEQMQELMLRITNEAEAYEIKPEDKNEKGELLVSPEGQVSNLGKQNELWWKIARTASFKEWFGNWQNKSKTFSKILDKNGEPLVVFRGVRSHFDLKDFYNSEFYDNPEHDYKYSRYLTGIYSSPDSKTPSAFANSTEKSSDGAVFSMFVNARNPLYKDSLKDMIHLLGEALKKDIRLLIPKTILKNIPKISIVNYDSFISEKKFGGKTENLEEADEIVLKDPEQLLIIPNTVKD